MEQKSTANRRKRSDKSVKEPELILPWKECVETVGTEKGQVYGHQVDTDVGHYLAFDHRDSCFWEFRQQGISVKSKHVKKGTARQEAEKDYLKRCGQYAKILNPGEVAVQETPLRVMLFQSKTHTTV